MPEMFKFQQEGQCGLGRVNGGVSRRREVVGTQIIQVSLSRDLSFCASEMGTHWRILSN